jgi:hypothetical protein
MEFKEQLGIVVATAVVIAFYASVLLAVAFILTRLWGR